MPSKNVLHLCLLIAGTFCAPKVYAQQHQDSVKVESRMPAFRGNLGEFMQQNLHYPDSARLNRIQGRAVVEFIVEASGLVDNIHLSRSSGNRELDEEAMRVVRLMQFMPYWTPGIVDGQPTAVIFTLPVTFSL